MAWSDNAPLVNAYTRRAGELTGVPGLGTFLTAVAFAESRGNPQAANPSSSALGWYQFVTGTARQLANDGGIPYRRGIETDPAISTWLAVLMVDSLVRRARAAGQQPTWLAIRRGWRAGRLVTDVNETDPQSSAVRERFENALAALGINRDFPHGAVVWPHGQLAWSGLLDALQGTPAPAPTYQPPTHAPAAPSPVPRQPARDSGGAALVVVGLALWAFSKGWKLS